MSDQRDAVIVLLDPCTSAILRAYASSRGQTREEAISALLYRQAAAMSGWPGQQGKELELALLGQMPAANAAAQQPDEWSVDAIGEREG